MHRESKAGQILCSILHEFYSGQRYLPSMIGWSQSCGERSAAAGDRLRVLQLPGECIAVKRHRLGWKPSVCTLARVESLKRTV
jgi:hypothetical protein